MNVAGNQDVSRETMRILQNMMHEVNPFADLLKSIEELSSEREGGLEEIRKVFRAENVPDPRRYFLGTNVIEAIIATRPKAGNIALIPKIKFITLATEGVTPYDFERIQFPVRLAFAMTINKSHGQTLDYAGLYLPKHVFAHGQLYVALLRARTPASIRIIIPSDISQLENQIGSCTHNIIFKEVSNVTE